jgi:competence protein ComGC
MSIYNKNNPGHGFTIVEVLIIAPIVILMIGIFISAIVSMTGEVLSSRGSNDMAYSVQNALDKIQQDVKLSGGFLSTNNIVLSSPQGYNNDTTNFDNASATVGDSLILNAYATTNNPLDTNRTIMYMAGQPNACNSTQLSQNMPVMVNIVYFVKDGTLWRRTVMPSNYLTIGCVGGSAGVPWQIPSCVPGYTGSFCKTNDERLVDGIGTDGFSVSYYSSPDSTTANTTAGEPSLSDSIRQSAIQTTTTVEVTISASDKISGRDISQSASMRATSQNDNVDASVDAYWSTFSLQNNWINYDTTYNPNGYRRTKDGVVILRGLIKRIGSITSGEIIGTLPISYRPSEQLIFQTGTNPNVGSRVDVNTDGTVRVIAGDPGWLSLEGIKFLASDSPSSFTNLGYLNSWTSYGSPFSPAAYTIDADGRVHTKGLVKSGLVTDGTVLATLPSGAYPSEYHHIAEHNSGAAGMIGVYTNGIQAKGGGNGYLSLQAIFYPASFSGWMGMALQNSWVYYGTPYSSPQYTKASDGLVTIHGLIKTGTIGATIATLPVGYRPAYRALFSTVSGGAVSRLDIDSSGNIIAVSGTNGWYSMDGISFYADQ